MPFENVLMRHTKHAKDAVTENYLKAAEFRYPDWIPVSVGIMPATWVKYGRDLAKIVQEHPKLFPWAVNGVDLDSITDEKNWDPGYRKGRFTDSWGCVWENIEPGLEGAVVESPLEDWENFKTYKAPDPIVQADRGPQVNWDELKIRFEQIKQKGGLASFGLPHGFMYMRLYYLRGFENFMLDVATDEPRLNDLIDMVLNHNMMLINKLLKIGVEMIYMGDDLGNQNALPISPAKWRKYIKPAYAKMVGACRENGVLVHLHTDGHILEIIDDLYECGVNIINPQVRANTLEGLARTAKGKMCINLDLDRQLFPFATPQQLKDHIREAIDTLAMPEGGLMLYAECEPDVPLKNIEVICETLEQMCFTKDGVV